MIVDCESCHTRFRLDDARIPATGAKVRCSRCKTAFIVHRPGATRQDAIDEVVAEATDPGSPRAPDATSDLLEASTKTGLTAQEPAGEGDEQWEFDEEPRPSPKAKGRKQAPAAAPARRPAKESAPAPQREEEELDSLGSPEDWDLLGGAARRIAEEASFRPDPEPAAAPKAIARAAPEPAQEASVDSALSTAAETHAAEPDQAAPAWQESLRHALGRAVEGAGWLAATALCAAGLTLALTPLAAPDDAASRPESAALDGVAQDLSVHTIESAIAGRLTVVRGRLAAGQRARLRATWVDSNGAAIAAASAIAGPPIAIRRLREYSLESLQAEHAEHSLELKADGPFEAVFGELPAGAARISITREPAVAAPPPVAADPAAAASPVAAPPVAAPSVAVPEAEDPSPTASSHPTARPSSE